MAKQPKPKLGRPTTYTDAIGDEICARVVMRPLHQVAADEDMPAEGVIYGWLGRNPDFADKYARARGTRALRRAESVDQVMTDMRLGVIDHQQARVLLDAIKWQAGKELPKVFGDRVQQEVSGPDGGPVSTESVIRVEFGGQ